MLRGKVHKLGANVDTDAIIAARYMTISDPVEMAKHLMEDTNPGFVQRTAPGDIIVATTNFGCGSSREHAPLVIKAAGISCVIAKSFARIFYRNAINIGLPLMESDEAVDGTSDGDTLEIDIAEGVIKNVTTGKVFRAKPYPEFMAGIISAGGLIEYTKQRLAGRRS